MRNQVHVIGAYPESVSNAKSGADGGTAEFAEMWCMRASYGFVRSSIFETVTESPSPCVVLVQGMWKVAYLVPPGVILWEIVVEQEM
jgi:hypothetical protein